MCSENCRTTECSFWEPPRRLKRPNNWPERNFPRKRPASFFTLPLAFLPRWPFRLTPKLAPPCKQKLRSGTGSPRSAFHNRRTARLRLLHASATISKTDVSLGCFLEARVGIEPTHKGFADLSLTTWVPRRRERIISNNAGLCHMPPGVAAVFSLVLRCYDFTGLAIRASRKKRADSSGGVGLI